MKKLIYTVLFLYSVLYPLNLKAEDGYRLWLRYDLIQDQQMLNEYKNSITGLLIEGNSSTISAAKNELQKGLEGLLGTSVPQVSSFEKNGILLAGAYKDLKNISHLDLIQ
ncbi:MAG TPA: alpha-glucuronidase family glycosyl hydrolase, partial [Ignavibacteriaceae bacterium]|nr:alpha-glucuronidase family glycosyl hydrolase [Ignavibacteriaceae bacterium]